MPKNTQLTPKSSESKDNSPLDPIAEFQQLKLETEEINKKIMMGPSLFNPSGNSSVELLGMVLNELKEMRMEIKEMKEDAKENQKRLEEVGENQKKLQEEVLKIQNGVTGIKKDLEEVQRNQEQHLHKSNVNEIKKEPESYSETDIRRQIYGKWRNVDDHKWYFSAKFEGDTFMEKENGCDSYDKYKLGVRDPKGWTTSVENNKIVQWCTAYRGEEIIRFEYYIENERLQRVTYSYGKEHSKRTFERYANPDPE